MFTPRFAQRRGELRERAGLVRDLDLEHGDPRPHLRLGGEAQPRRLRAGERPLDVAAAASARSRRGGRGAAST